MKFTTIKNNYYPEFSFEKIGLLEVYYVCIFALRKDVDFNHEVRKFIFSF